MTRTTRRDFLATTSLVTAGLALGARTVLALPRSILNASYGANAILPEPLASADLQAVATHAVDAARAAGATYADIRVSERRRLNLDFDLGGALQIQTDSTYDYGIRVFVNGASAFTHGTVPTLDAVANSARRAVATARGYAALSPRQKEFVPAPVVTGSWKTPIQIDPFDVPLGTQVDLMQALQFAVGRVDAVRASAFPRFRWECETRVFGSSEGSLVTQTFYRSERNTVPGVAATLFPPADVWLSNFGPVSGGYESVLLPNLQDQIAAAAEIGLQRSKLPVKDFDVGRFPVVFDGHTLGALLGQSLGQALELDRALGRESDASGSTFLSPTTDVLGGAALNPLLNVTGNKKMPSLQAVRWDDDGVEPEEFTLINAGRVVDYCTTRETAGHLRAWYESKGQPVRSNGCAFARRAESPVDTRMPHLYVAPSATAASVEDLYRDIPRGLLVLQSTYFSMDQQLASGFLGWGQMYEIARGRIVRRIQNAGLSFATRGLWKNFAALGGAETVRDAHFGTMKGNPWRGAEQVVTAPAGRFNAVDVVATGRTLR